MHSNTIETYYRIAYILTEPDLAKIFFSQINLEYDIDNLVFNHHLQIILYKSIPSIVIYNKSEATSYTIMLLLIEQMLFKTNMQIPIDTYSIAGPRSHILSATIDLYKLYDNNYQFPGLSTNIIKSIVNVCTLIKVRRPDLIEKIAEFNYDSVCGKLLFKNIDSYHKIISTLTPSDKYILIFDKSNKLMVTYIYVDHLKIFGTVITPMSIVELESRQQDILNPKNKRVNFKRIAEASDDNMNVYTNP